MKVPLALGFVLIARPPVVAEFLQEDREWDPALAVFDGARVEGIAFDGHGRAVAGSAKGLFREEEGRWRLLAEGTFGKVKRGGDGKLYAASGKILVVLGDEGKTAPVLEQSAPIGDFAVGPNGEVLVAGPIFTQDTVTPLLLYEKDPDLRATYLESFRRSWEIERPERSPLWNFIHNWAFGNRTDLRQSLEGLEDMPWELYQWSHDNSRRWDLPLSHWLRGEAESARALGMKERGPYYFSDNPYTLRSGDGGATVESPAIYLVPYWLGRHHRLIAPGE